MDNLFLLDEKETHETAAEISATLKSEKIDFEWSYDQLKVTKGSEEHIFRVFTNLIIGIERAFTLNEFLKYLLCLVFLLVGSVSYAQHSLTLTNERATFGTEYIPIIGDSQRAYLADDEVLSIVGREASYEGLIIRRYISDKERRLYYVFLKNNVQVGEAYHAFLQGKVIITSNVHADVIATYFFNNVKF